MKPYFSWFATFCLFVMMLQMCSIADNINRMRVHSVPMEDFR